MKLFARIAGPLSFVIALVLIKFFGTKVGLTFMLITAVVIIAASAVLRELTKNKRKDFQDEIKKLLAGSTMHEHLMKNPARLDVARRWNQDYRNLLYRVLEPDDARRVKQLLEEK